MRSIVISSILLGFATVGTAQAQGAMLQGGPTTLDCRPILTQQTEKGVSVTRGFRAKDRTPAGTMGGYRCYDVTPRAAMPAPTAGARSNQTIIILNGNGLPFGFNAGTSPNVLGAPQARRF